MDDRLYSNVEDEDDKFVLRDGETYFFENGRIEPGTHPDFDEGCVPRGTFAVAKNNSELFTESGSCVITCLRETGEKIGAMIHIDFSHIPDTSNSVFEKLYDTLFERFPQISSDAKVDILINSDEAEDLHQSEDFINRWLEGMTAYFQERDFEEVNIVKQSTPMLVRVDTESGSILVTDSENEELVYFEDR